MAHYAFLDQANIVIRVIVGKDETEQPDGAESWEDYYGNIHETTCKRTSYNTHAGQHLNGKTPFRKNYAGIGYQFDPIRDAFIPPKPYPSWTLDEDTCTWMPPTPRPDDGDSYYLWDEDNQMWVPVDIDPDGA